MTRMNNRDGLQNLRDFMVEDIMAMSDEEILAEVSPEEIEATRRIGMRALAAASDGALLTRALGILHRMATENTGWRSVWSRWYYSDEPLRNDAANLVREAQFGMMQPINTRLVGDPE